MSEPGLDNAVYARKLLIQLELNVIDRDNEIFALRAQLAKAIEALRPFAEIWNDGEWGLTELQRKPYQRAAEVYKELTRSWPLLRR